MNLPETSLPAIHSSPLIHCVLPPSTNSKRERIYRGKNELTYETLKSHAGNSEFPMFTLQRNEKQRVWRTQAVIQAGEKIKQQ